MNRKIILDIIFVINGLFYVFFSFNKPYSDEHILAFLVADSISYFYFGKLLYSDARENYSDIIFNLILIIYNCYRYNLLHYMI